VGIRRLCGTPGPRSVSRPGAQECRERYLRPCPRRCQGHRLVERGRCLHRIEPMTLVRPAGGD